MSSVGYTVDLGYCLSVCSALAVSFRCACEALVRAHAVIFLTRPNKNDSFVSGLANAAAGSQLGTRAPETNAHIGWINKIRLASLATHADKHVQTGKIIDSREEGRDR